MWPGVGVGGVDVDVGDRHAKLLGSDLARYLLHALAEIDGRQRDGELALGIGMHQRLARVTPEVHADRVVDRRHAASAMLGHAAISCACRTRWRSAWHRVAGREWRAWAAPAAAAPPPAAGAAWGGRASGA